MASFRPPPRQTVSQWADAHRQLSRETSSEPGQWRTRRVEFSREIMDALTEPDVEEVVFVKSSQVCGTEILLNFIGFIIDRSPCAVLFILPKEATAKKISIKRVAPMIRDTPVLAEKVNAPKSRDTGNTILFKKFPGGDLTLVGVNAPDNLASDPICVVLSDEDDRQTDSAGDEGDPWDLAWTRTTTFRGRRKGMRCSTPVKTATSRILRAFAETDQRYYHIPCPRCGALHTLAWANVKWDKHPDGSVNYDTIRHVCPHCDGSFTNTEKDAAVADCRRARWIPTAPFTGKRGYRINALYSPFISIEEIVRKWYAAQGDPSKLQTFFNTVLGEGYDGETEQVTFASLSLRCEKYTALVPLRAVILTAGVDVQPDRLEVTVIGWGAGEESWLVEHIVIYGDPDIPEGQRGSPWDALTDALHATYRHETGADLDIAHACIDTGGSNTQAVYNYCKRHRSARLFAIKGRSGFDRPVIELGARKRTGRQYSLPVRLYLVGVDSAKYTIVGRLRIADPGAGYCHFPAGTSDEHFRQLAAEKLITTYKRGRKIQTWEKSSKARNEALDCRVYAYAALILANPNYARLAERIRLRAPKTVSNPKPQTLNSEPNSPPSAQDAPAENQHHADPKPARRKGRRGAWVQSWR